ncbi:hypothetical protein EDD17DRAFT_711085 [Pisolithus thermaeus]|nr:hypothetical protein EDD17DRAFT_711085 [Pisolithus thermaeus]
MRDGAAPWNIPWRWTHSPRLTIFLLYPLMTTSSTGRWWLPRTNARHCYAHSLATKDKSHRKRYRACSRCIFPSKSATQASHFAASYQGNLYR